MAATQALPTPGTEAYDAVVLAASCGPPSGRRRAFDILVRLHWAEARRVCVAIAGPAGEDAVQDAFVKAYRAMQGGMPQRFRTWLLRIARNQALDLRRARVRYHDLLETSAPISDRDERSPEERVMLRQRVARIRRALDENVSNPNQRDAFLMRMNTRLNDDEIGEVLGVSAKAVRSYVSKTRKMLFDAICEA